MNEDARPAAEQQRIRRRLAELEAEYTQGQELLRQLAEEERRLREDMLRIDGAMTVIRELLVDQPPSDGSGETADPDK